MSRALSGRERLVVASSSEDAELMELRQLQNDEGPCLECYRTAAPVSVPDLDERPDAGPGSRPRSRTKGGSAPCTRCRCGCGRSARPTCSTAARSTSRGDLALGQALADVATIGILQERAIQRREVVIEQSACSEAPVR